jgi:hypothetical protein
MPLKPKTCPRCGVSLPWEMDTTYLAEMARWLSHRRVGRLCSGEDTHQFYEDPHKWIAERLEGDLHAEFEAERKVAA